ncbi:MAG: Peptidyl-tRNA hydrolase, partial [Solirubrobacteraceae bacterium]|nr:Peptidyl-tRNA hydrolase [Solirubrobacteraceae bacterium]
DGVVVRDAGLTEIAPGTETVMALAPGERPDGVVAL